MTLSDASSSEVSGAEALVLTAVGGGARVCFANPGTTEMPLVAALDSAANIRAVLGLQENVCTGAADGYARVTGHPALTLLHLGPGLANGLANLHNARRAHSPVVNIVGDHASWHLPYDAPLTSDIAALAGTVGSVHTVGSRSSIAAATRTAMDDARTRRGVSTLIVPEDFQQSVAAAADSVAGAARSTFHSGEPSGENTSTDKMEVVIAELRQAGGSAVILLGGAALSRAGQQAAGRIAATTGARLFSETFPARAERGGGLPDIDRLPYFPEVALAVLKDAPIVVLVGATEPIAYFGYDGVPSTLTQPGTLRRLAGVHDDAEAMLCELADLFAAPAEAIAATPPTAPPDTAALTGRSVGATLATLLPEGAIVSIEGGTCGYPFYTASAGAAPHSVLTNTGGAIGQGLPCALGAAIAAPDRPVIALQSDGSGLYTAQALWTMAREGCDVVVLIAANHTYNVLRTELARHGHSELGPRAAGLTSLADPPIDWVALANGFGVEATRVETVRQLHDAFTPAVTRRGPHLIEMTVQP